MAISPTAEGFRTAFRQPALALTEISWRWVTGATALATFFFGLFEYLDTLPVNRGELLFLRSHQPYLISEAVAHILRGSRGRVVLSGMIAVLLIALIWMVTAAVGRIATVRSMLDHFRKDTAGDVSTNRPASLRGLVRLNFLRAIAALAAIFGFVGAAILAGFASPDANPRPGLAFLLFLPMAALICLAWYGLNWLLSLAAMFAVRDGADALPAITSAVDFCRDRTGAIAAVSSWTGLAHLVAFVGMTTVLSMPLGFAAILPWRLVLLAMILILLTYFALADWLYTARLAGYVCIAETPEALMKPAPPIYIPPANAIQVASAPALQTTIDRDEPILSDQPLPTDSPF